MDLRSVQAVHVVVHSNKAPFPRASWRLTQQGWEGIWNHSAQQRLHPAQHMT